MEQTKWAQRKDEEIQRPADFFVDQERSGYLGYTIERRVKKHLLYNDETSRPNHFVEVNYVTVRKSGEGLRTFDAGVYSGFGGDANFGYFPFLGGETNQLFISQDIFRGGCQWIVSLSPRFQVIFDIQEFSIGREAWDLGAVDLNKDGVYEITAPVTDFYAFQDKMGMSGIPLPDIIFKYDPTKAKYLPANPTFKSHALKGLVPVTKFDKIEVNNARHLSAVLNNLLTYIYAGEEKQGWDFYDHNYQLDDKEEIRTRVVKILREQPVYNLIYKRRKRK